MSNAHTIDDLKQMQSLPLEAKIRMTKERIETWYHSWTRFEIYNKATGKTRYVTMDTREPLAEPKLKETEWIESAHDGQVYLSFSGGKDSTVLKHIIDSMGLEIPSVFVNTGLEYPEIQRFVRDVKDGKYDCFNPDVTILTPEMRFDKVVKEYGYPFPTKEIAQLIREAKIGLSRGDGSYKYRIYRITGTGNYAVKDGKKSLFDCSEYRYLLDAPFEVSEQCCNVMKKNPGKKYQKETGRKVIMATMADESRIRRKHWVQYGCNAFDNEKQPSSNPMSFWTEDDVLHYIKKYNIPYCSVYGDIVPVNSGQLKGQLCMADDEDFEGIKLKTTGCERTGCMFCLYGIIHDGNPNRIQKMKLTHPKQYQYCLKPLEEGGLGLKRVLEYINVDYE